MVNLTIGVPYIQSPVFASIIVMSISSNFLRKHLQRYLIPLAVPGTSKLIHLLTYYLPQKTTFPHQKSGQIVWKQEMIVLVHSLPLGDSILFPVTVAVQKGVL